MLVAIRQRQVGGDPRWRGAIGLGKNDVVSDRAGAKFAKPAVHRRQPAARPRPLPECFDRGLVDIDNPHWLRAVRPRQQSLIGIKGAIPKFGDHPGIEGA